MMDRLGPAKSPCGSCPYRKDVPPGVWHEEEYAKLPLYDAETGEQPTHAFFCHQANQRLCAGWVGCHDMDESMALRVGFLSGLLSPEACEEARAYVSPVPLFASGAEAAEYGRSGRTPETIRTIKRLSKKIPQEST